ncbi:MAG: EpsG family protein [Mesorhizobium sp.]|uniref:EpsG family protein n=1 Tax=Mesorhizobium sp. TaxID=1871066 RepID=UPI0012266C6B|nr:EpsG family protein [Mesorhizobium sp.]TIP05722.1 MAG: EpsG family protein [Mesorhizobium sp.]
MIYVAITNSLFLLRYVLLGQIRLNRQLYLVVVVLLFVFSAFRHEVGCDWSGYLNEYDQAANMPLKEISWDNEALWWTVLWLQNYLDIPYPWINVLSSAICFSGVHVLARRQLDPLGFLVLLFPVLVINMPMSAIRQGAAIGLLCIALTRFLDGRSVAFGIWVFLAASFHSSALVFLLLVPLATRQITPQRIGAAVLLAAPGAFMLMSAKAAQKASFRYIDTGVDAFGALFRISLLALSGAFFFFALSRVWKRDYPDDYPLVAIGSAGMLFLGALLPVSSVIADRLGYYLIPIQALIFARIPEMRDLPHKALLGALPYLGLLLFFVVWTISSWHFQQCYLPYQSWIFGPPG